MYNMRNVTLPLSPCDSLFETIIQLVYKRKIVCGERDNGLLLFHMYRLVAPLFLSVYIQIVTKTKNNEYFLLF